MQEDTATPQPTEVKKQSFWEMVRFGVTALVVVLVVRTFIIQPFVVSGSSMLPTFENGDYLIIDEISYKLGEPGRDDVVVFRYPNDPEKFFIKRIIGLPGETIDIKNGTITVTNEEYPDGFQLGEPFLQNETERNLHFSLKEGEYFVMGDNRSASSDSRYWGPVSENLLIGRALLRLWPIKKIDFLPGSYEPSK